MAKRFTDTDKWKDEWFGSLSNDYRMIWLYLVDSCSIAGIWKKDFRGLNFNCNTNVDEASFLKVFSTRVIDRGNYFFIPKFLLFQYPKGLNSDKPAIVSVRKEIEQNNLYLIIRQSFPNGFLTIKDKDKDKEQDEETEQRQRQGEAEKDFSLPDVGGDEIHFPIDTKPVRECWAKWKQYRYTQHSKVYGMYGEQAALKQLEGMNEQQILNTLFKAIESNWLNLYPDKNGNGKTKQRGFDVDGAKDSIADYIAKHG